MHLKTKTQGAMRQKYTFLVPVQYIHKQVILQKSFPITTNSYYSVNYNTNDIKKILGFMSKQNTRKDLSQEILGKFRLQSKETMRIKTS